MATDTTSGRPQDDVIAFLADASSHGPGVARVEVIETHGALVFLAGDSALKIKRAVRLPYFDFSTLAKREAACRRELDINRPNAPEIYRDVIAITRTPDGRLHAGGDGEPIEWAVRMVRFDQAALLSSIADRNGVDDRLAAELADTMLSAHAAAENRSVGDAGAQMASIIDGIGRGFAATPRGPDVAERHARFVVRSVAHLERVAGLLRRRAEAGLVRRCHGDAHLGNIVLWKDHPQLFDAIEFDETLATIDVLYDLAFLLMDLDRRGARRAARIVLERYLAGTGRALDIEALAALPLFLGLRAAIRSMVAFDRATAQADPEKRETERHAADTLARATDYLEPPPARLIAIGGFSGTGKTTLARELAPHFLPAPGALHLRSDVLRKELAGVPELHRLPPAAYGTETSDGVYRTLLEQADRVLRAGHSVVVDAVFAHPRWRAAISDMTSDAGARFDGIWLEATAELLKARVANRSGDASDATPDVVQRQVAAGAGDISWHRVAATGDPADVLDSALRVTRLRT